MRRYSPGESLTADNANRWEAAIASRPPVYDNSSNYYNPVGRYDIQVKKDDVDIATRFPPFAPMYVRAAAPSGTHGWEYRLQQHGVYDQTFLTPVILDCNGIPAGYANGWASFAFTPVTAAVEQYDQSQFQDFTTVQFGIEGTKFGLVMGKYGFTALMPILETPYNGVNIIIVQRQIVYPTFITGGINGDGDGALSFTTSETFYKFPIGYASNYNFNPDMSPYIERYYQVVVELSELQGDSGNNAKFSVDITPYKEDADGARTPIGDMITFESYDGSTLYKTAHYFAHALSFGIKLKPKEYIVLGVKGTASGTFACKFKSIT